MALLEELAGLLGADQDDGLITYHDTGCLVIKTPYNQNLEKVCAMMDAVGCPYEHVPADRIAEYMQGADAHQFAPAKRFDDPAFGEPSGDSVAGAVFFPRGGYVNDPKLSAQNVQRVAEALGAMLKFNAAVSHVLTENGRFSGVKLADGSTITASVVVNVAGPHSARINEMAGVADTMRMSTRVLRHEGAHVPAPAGFLTEKGVVFSDSDIDTYSRPERGNHLLIGSEDSECDEKECVDDPDDYDFNFSTQ